MILADLALDSSASALLQASIDNLNPEIDAFRLYRVYRVTIYVDVPDDPDATLPGSICPLRCRAVPFLIHPSINRELQGTPSSSGGEPCISGMLEYRF
jgi:hypothetical protein